MRFFRTINKGSKGFTLVEVIVTIIAAGILGAIFVNFMGTALSSSWNAVETTRDEANAEALLEKIVAEYVAAINSTPSTALVNIAATYGGQTIDGVSITTEYITFNTSGNEQSGGSTYLKIVLQPTGLSAPAIAGRHRLTAILAENRDTDDHFIIF